MLRVVIVQESLGIPRLAGHRLHFIGVAGLQLLQPAHVVPRPCFLQNQRVARGGRLHVRAVGRLTVDVVDLVDRAVVVAQLLDAARLVLKDLPASGVVGLFRRVAPDENLEPIRVAGIQIVVPADDAAFALLQVAGAPWCVDVMQSHQALLHVGTGAQLRRRTQKEADRSGIYRSEQLGLGNGGSVVVDECNLALRHALGHKFGLDVVVDRELGRA